MISQATQTTTDDISHYLEWVSLYSPILLVFGSKIITPANVIL